ncbi:Amino acid/polyamine transporter I [Artemisia annua]|uniref:Amino acid/polyamine transporter I n=1 Tax=Artemisia annua TaxID=35608 RepID=A0A2U1KAB8_ARTAN|nr:Amino acid/polyamine transporter I [Artemisia annua]
MLCIPPAFLLILVMCLASARTFLVTGLVLVLGFILYPAIIHAKKKNWVHFMSDDDVHSNDRDIGDHENPTLPVDDEAEVSLLSDLSSSKTEKVSEIFPEVSKSG